MPRYVLLRHECPPDYREGPHWDFMLEERDALLTWALKTLPSNWCEALGLETVELAREVAANSLPPHRKAYLDYEGPVSRGRGAVARAARGEFEWVEHPGDGFAIRFTSGELPGSVTLRADGLAWELWTGD